MNEMIYFKTYSPLPKTKKSQIKTQTYSKKSALLLTHQLGLGYICSCSYIGKAAHLKELLSFAYIGKFANCNWTAIKRITA